MEYFHYNIQGWCNFYDLYQDIIRKMPADFKFAEIGVWKGHSLAFFAVHSLKECKQGNIFAIDHWQGSKEHLDPKSPFFEAVLHNNPDGLYELFIQNIAPARNLITVIRKGSIEASKTFENESLDAIFIDASHEYEDVLQDLISWYPKKKQNGIFCGHDYDWPGVKKAVDEFCRLNNLKSSPISNTSWIIT